MNWVMSRPESESALTVSSAALGSWSASDSAASSTSSASATPRMSITSSSLTSLPP